MPKKHSKKALNKSSIENQSNNAGWISTFLYTLIRIPVDHPKTFLIGLLGVSAGIYKTFLQNQLQSSRPNNPCETYFNQITDVNITEANLVVLLETHDIYKTATIPCIEQYNPEIAYSEGTPLNLKVMCSSYGIEKPGRECFGWDYIGKEVIERDDTKCHVTAVEAVMNLFKECEELAKIYGNHETNFDLILKDILADLRAKRDKSAEQYHFSANTLKSLDYNYPSELMDYRQLTHLIRQHKYLQQLREEGNDILSTKNAYQLKFQSMNDYQRMQDSITYRTSKLFVELRNAHYAKALKSQSCVKKTLFTSGSAHALPYPKTDDPYNNARKMVWNAIDQLNEKGCKVAVFAKK